MALPYQPVFVPAPVGMPASFQVWALQVVTVLNGVLAGKQNNIGEVTLTHDAASTSVSDARISPFSVLVFMPLTANAATELAAGTMFVSAQTAGSATLNHANAASTDRRFRFVMFG